MTYGRFQASESRSANSTQGRLDFLEYRLDRQDKLSDERDRKRDEQFAEVVKRVDSMRSDFTELRNDIAKRSDSMRPGISISGRTLKLLAPLAIAFGAGLATLTKFLIEVLAGR